MRISMMRFNCLRWLMKKLISFFLLLCSFAHGVLAQDLFEERIWKIPGRKKSVFLDKGIFHLKTEQKKSKLERIRHSYQKDQGIERVVIDFTTAQVPTIYGIYNRNHKKIQIDFSETEIDSKNQLNISTTRPTCPSSSLTLMPLEWKVELVSSAWTIPLVRIPLRWSFLRIISTSSPG